jgi:hypothetical protein
MTEVLEMLEMRHSFHKINDNTTQTKHCLNHESIGWCFRAPEFQIPRRGRNGPLPAGAAPAREATAEQLLL